MIEALARAAGRDVSRETLARLEIFVSLLKAETARQNLVSGSTLDDIWQRHILDSAQLARFQPYAGASWADIGSGAGLPGIVIACLVSGPVTLIEPRKLRANFLARTIAKLALNARVEANRVERVSGKFETITARAVAPLARLVEMSQHLSTEKTIWVLPKGRSAESELAEARRSWQGVFHVEQSLTDTQSRILVGTGVRAKTR